LTESKPHAQKQHGNFISQGKAGSRNGRFVRNRLRNGARVRAGTLSAKIGGQMPAHANHRVREWLDGLRVAYFVFHITDKTTLRSITWVGGLACTIGLFAPGA
jgi:uncharacterized MAPEG superfamily protein